MLVRNETPKDRNDHTIENCGFKTKNIFGKTSYTKDWDDADLKRHKNQMAKINNMVQKNVTQTPRVESPLPLSRLPKEVKFEAESPSAGGTQYPIDPARYIGKLNVGESLLQVKLLQQGRVEGTKRWPGRPKPEPDTRCPCPKHFRLGIDDRPKAHLNDAALYV